MTRKEFAKKEKISVNSLTRIYELLKLGLGAKEIQQVIGMPDYNASRANYFKFNRIMNFLMYENINTRSRIKFFEPVIERKYWKNEDEMLIQNYRAEDLTGSELEILNKLNNN